MTPRILLLAALVLAPSLRVSGQGDPRPETAPTRVFADSSVERREVLGKPGVVTHLWVLEQRGSSFRLLHRTSEHREGELYLAFEGEGRVESIAAREDRLLLAFSSRTLQWVGYQRAPPPQPPGYPESRLPSLPEGAGRTLVSAGAGGAYALLFATSNPLPPDSPGSRIDATLLRCAGPEWVSVALPIGLEPDNILALMAPDTPGMGPVLVTAEGAGLSVHRMYESRWSSVSYTLRPDPGAPRFLLYPHEDAWQLLTAQPQGVEGGTALDLAWLRDGEAVPLASIPLEGSEGWWLGVGEGGPLLIARTSGGEYRTTVIPFPRGLAPGSKPAWVASRESERPWELNPIYALIGVAMFILFLVLVQSGRRQGEEHVPRLPPNMQPAVVTRIAAAVVDFTPGVCASIVYFQIKNPLEIFSGVHEPLEDLVELYPLFLAIGVHVGHTTITELLTGSTLGKAILGCRVVNYEGRRPGVAAVLLRNFFKVVEMILPLWLIVVVLTPKRQRLGDLIARTLVVTPAPPERPPPRVAEKRRAEDE